jgi:hypothetical protein
VSRKVACVLNPEDTDRYSCHVWLGQQRSMATHSCAWSGIFRDRNCDDVSGPDGSDRIPSLIFHGRCSDWRPRLCDTHEGSVGTYQDSGC